MVGSEQQNCVDRTPTSPDDRTASIRALNDQFRQTLVGGRVMLTSGVQALG